MTRSIRLALLSLTAVLLASCLDYREELWIKGNGSGRLHATITLKSEIGVPLSEETKPDQVEAQLREMFSATDGANVESYETYVDGKRRVYDLTVAFQDIRKLKPAVVAGNNNIGAIFGDFEIARVPDGKLAIKRVVKLSDSEPETVESEEPELGDALGKAFGGLVAEAMLSNYKLEYITHFPTEIVSANTPAIDRESNTVTWTYTLAEASQGPLTMTADIKRPGGWMMWIFGAFILVITAAIVVPALRKRNKA